VGGEINARVQSLTELQVKINCDFVHNGALDCAELIG